MSDAPHSPRRRTLAWVSSTYFAEGLPYMLVRVLSGVFFTDIGAKERYIGYLNFLGFPWNFKFIWAPLVDAYGTKRSWMIGAQTAIGVLTVLVALVCLLARGDTDPSGYLETTAVLFAALAFLSATNDIAIDGYYLEGLTDRGDQAAYSGVRVLAYRLSMVFVRSGLVALAAWAASTLGDGDKYAPWALAFGAGALTMLALSAFHLFFAPRFEAKRDVPRPHEVLWSFGRAFKSYLDQPRVLVVLVFIIVYKLGDEILFSMVTPFLMRELAITTAQYAWIGGLVGAAGSVFGAMFGGWWIKKRGLKRAIWPLTLAMNLNIWAYIWLASEKPDPTTFAGISLIAFVHGYEQLAAGIGSAALLVFLLGTCKPEFKAAHYALGSAIMSLGSTLFGGFGGRLVEAYGYLNLFLIAFFASLPSMVLLFFVPLEPKKAAPPPSGSG